MRLYDAFMTCNREKLTQAVAATLPTEPYDPTPAQLAAAAQKLVTDAYARMAQTALSGSAPYSLYVVKTFAAQELENPFDAFGVKPAALQAWRADHPADPFTLDEEQAGTEALLALMEGLPLPERYGLEFVEWAELLACPLADACAARYGLEACLAYILYDMTFFGVEPEKMRAESDELQRRAAEAERERAAGNEDYFIPAEKVFADLREKYGWEEPTEQERRQWRRAAAINAYRYDRELWGLL